MNDKSTEISMIAKLVSQQSSLLDALSESHSLKKDLTFQANRILKAITIYHGGKFLLDRNFLDSAEDDEIELEINNIEGGSIEFKIKEG